MAEAVWVIDGRVALTLRGTTDLRLQWLQAMYQGVLSSFPCGVHIRREVSTSCARVLLILSVYHVLSICPRPVSVSPFSVSRDVEMPTYCVGGGYDI